MLFPYSSGLVKAKLEGAMNHRFGSEFVRILRRTTDYLESFKEQRVVGPSKGAAADAQDSPRANVL